MRVAWSLNNAGVWKTAGVIEDASDSWGPVVVEGTALEVSVRLEGDQVIPQERRFRPPDRGESVRLHFSARLGNALWIVPIDRQGEILTEGHAVLSWTDDGASVETAYGARPDGYIHATGLPDGPVRAHVTCPGYSVGNLSVVLPLEEEAAYSVVLNGGSDLQGIVTSESGPVRDFKLIVWALSDPLLRVVDTFTDREDGAFSLTVPTGRIAVVATSAAVGTSATMHLTGEESAPVKIEIPLPASLEGRVVDDATGLGIPGARVEAQLYASAARVGSVGAPCWSDLDGEFTLDALPEGELYLEVSAESYAAKRVAARTVRAGQETISDVRLFKSGRLTLRLPENAKHLAGLTLAADGPTPLGGNSIGADGTARFDGVGPGSYAVSAFLGDEAVYLQRYELVPGPTEWELPFELGGSCHLTVTVGDELRRLLEDDNGLLIDGYATTGSYQWKVAAFEFPVTCTGLYPGDVTVRLVTASRGSQDPVAQARVTLRPGDNELELSAGERGRLRVVDAMGAPIAGAEIHAADADGHWVPGMRTTDVDGLCDLPSVLDAGATLAIAHLQHGYRVNVEYLPIPNDPFEVELAGDAKLVIVLSRKDGGFAVGLRPELRDAQGQFHLLTGTANESGEVRFAKLHEGTYRITLSRPDYWPVSQDVRATVDGPPVIVPTRRRRTIELAVTLDGLPWDSAPVELTYVDSGQDVRTFLGDEWGVTTNTGSLTADDSGLLVLEGAPEGEYAWSVPGTNASGEFLVLVGDEDAIPITVFR